nr:AP 3 complex subunit mu 1 [Hymenolepis microstoma]
MIRSIFVINKDRDVLLEKHWKSITPRLVLDSICEGQSKLLDPLKVPPVFASSNNVILITVEKNGIFFIATCTEEVPPLLIIEFLNSLISVYEDYFGTMAESTITENIVCAFELLDEMLDNGFPLTTELNILKEIIKPPKLLRSITEVVTGRTLGNVNATLPANQLTNIRWRRAGVKYTTNEAFFDMTERVNVIIDRSGNILLAEIEGTIDCLVHLSGMPDLSLSFNNPRLLDDVSLHPCVRYFRWEKQRIISFVPPDGKFRLFSYFIPAINSISLPLALRHNISLKESGSRFELSVSPKATAGKTLEEVKVMVLMPSEVSGVNVTPSLGRAAFDTATKTLTWDVGLLEPRTYPSLKGTVTLHNGTTQISSTPVVNLHFVFPQTLVSGLRVSRLEMHRENYNPYKGVKYMTVSGNYEVRI